MQRSLLPAIILVLAFLGLADSWYLAQAALADTALSCGIDVIDECNIVAQSEYSRLWGVPLALYGVGFYILVFVLAAALLVFPRPWHFRTMFWTSVLGLLASLYFLYVQIFLIKALCVYCLASFIIAILLLATAWVLHKKEAAVVLP